MEYKKIDTTLVFKNKVNGFSISEKRKIRRFIELFANGGFEKIDNYQIQSYRVRNKSSDDVNKKAIKFAYYPSWYNATPAI